MNRRKLLNSLMVVVILFTVICGIMAAGSLKGWFRNTEPALTAQNTEETILKIEEKSGIVFVERKGISYELKENDLLQDGDQLYTKGNSKLQLADSDGRKLILSAETKLTVVNIEEAKFLLPDGELFADSAEQEMKISLDSEETTAIFKNSIASISAYQASQTIYVYSGDVLMESADLEESVNAAAGHEISLLTDLDGNVSAECSAIILESLNDEQIQNLLSYTKTVELCFTAEKLENVLAVREEEKQAAQQAQLLLGEQAKKELEKEEKNYENQKQNAQQTNTSQSITVPDAGSTDTTTEKAENSGSGESSSQSSADVKSDAKGYCTIEIRCDTILDNMENLTSGKEGYVPSNGTILTTSKIEFYEGETVFEVLKRACSRTGIALEYSWTPLYGSYYIEGINHLYEFDCGNESGWMYKVNGWFPNYGCSSYSLKDGDAIVWCYTCNGLGADVGGGEY